MLQFDLFRECGTTQLWLRVSGGILGAYRVRDELLQAWGGLSVKNGFIQRSAVPPRILQPKQFYEWFLEHRVPLVGRNN